MQSTVARYSVREPVQPAVLLAEQLVTYVRPRDYLSLQFTSGVLALPILRCCPVVAGLAVLHALGC